MQIYCAGCRDMFDQAHMRIVRDAYWCDECRKAKKYEGKGKK